MKKNFMTSFLVISIFLNTFILNAKEVTPKFGKISIDELNNMTCPIDSGAHAYFLFDEGTAFYTYSESFNLHYSRHFRIKILDKSGFENSVVTIPYSTRVNYKSIVSNIRAVTYNLEGNEITNTELDKDEIFDEKTNKYWNQIKFALPNVKEGSIIEISYDIKLGAINELPDWQFQYFIPVLQSNYRCEIPEYFIFNQFHRGSIFAKTNTEEGSGIINLENGQTKQYKSTIFNYTSTKLPAFPIGEQLTTPKNYLAKIDFEIGSIKDIYGRITDFSNKWEDVNELFLKDLDFGEQLKTINFEKEYYETILNSNYTEFEKMQQAFLQLKNKMRWDAYCTCWPTNTLQKAFDKGIGNSADINLNLVGLLRKVGLVAAPVLLSTRENGMIHPAYGSIDQMNYVIAMCQIDSTTYLLDATDKNSEIDLLPERCLNGNGWIVDEARYGWIPLLCGKKSKMSAIYVLELTLDNKFIGKINLINKEFSALKKRIQIKSFASNEEYINNLQENNQGLIIQKSSFKNLDTIAGDLKTYYEVKIENNIEVAGDLLYFSPMLYDSYKKNPFYLETREYPVEYPYPILESLTSIISIPKEYKIESMPKPIEVLGLNDECYFSFRTGVKDGNMIFVSALMVNQTLITAAQYEEIKNFFEEVVKKHQEKVVLKKI